MDKLICEGTYDWVCDSATLAGVVCTAIIEKTNNISKLKGKWKFEFIHDTEIPWPWPDITKVLIGPAAHGVRGVSIAQGKNWVRIMHIEPDRFGVFDKYESRIAIRGTSHEVVLLKGTA